MRGREKCQQKTPVEKWLRLSRFWTKGNNGFQSNNNPMSIGDSMAEIEIPPPKQTRP
jgi:hypothetical protein